MKKKQADRDRERVCVCVYGCYVKNDRTSLLKRESFKIRRDEEEGL